MIINKCNLRFYSHCTHISYTFVENLRLPQISLTQKLSSNPNSNNVRRNHFFVSYLDSTSKMSLSGCHHSSFGKNTKFSTMYL